MNDHAIPWIVLTPITSNRGRGFWRLNVMLLSDKEFVAACTEEINAILQEKKNSVLKWKWLKFKIREMAFKYSSIKNKSRNNKLSLFEKKMQQYNKLLAELCAEGNH